MLTVGTPALVVTAAYARPGAEWRSHQPPPISGEHVGLSKAVARR
jgi:hypothetical protein